ncbi:MAG: D-alanine--D-alanine ligase [Candidatus Aminicenantes bacterium]|nr:MAG: D-alanine--D-alanine ligase [Candidatus Aminicenantes bacterium]
MEKAANKETRKNTNSTKDTKAAGKTGKISVGILFGGQSAEHEVSLKSTEALYNNLDKTKFTPRLIYISRDHGRWRVIDEKRFYQKDFLTKPHHDHSFLPWLDQGSEKIDADIYFPMLHGPNGEDGKIQGLLELAGKPYVGANSVASALAMDKVVAKILFQKAGLNVVDYLFFENSDYTHIKEAIVRRFSYPVFIKPSFMGSSVGISKVKEETQLKAGLDLAFRYDRKILVEKALPAREIEVSVMGNDEIMVSRPGELIPHREFYDYNDKYINGKTTFYMPAKLDPKVESEVRQVAAKAYKALFLNGMSRVDLFIEKNTGKIYVNEINTIPGFTEISMFPKLWTLQGISFTELITRLIDYGFDYHQKHKAATDR